LSLLFTLLGINVNAVSSNVYIVGRQLHSFQIVEQFPCFDVVVPRMQWAFDHLSVYLSGSKRAILMAAERFNGIILAVCIEKSNSTAINVKFLAAVFFNLASWATLTNANYHYVVISLAIKWLSDSRKYALLRHI